MNLFKTIKEGDSMLALIRNVLSNLDFYLEHMDFLNNIGYSREYLLEYKGKLEKVFLMYADKTIPAWFENYNAYLLMSGDFPYIAPYLDFCFSFGDMIDMVLLINDSLYVEPQHASLVYVMYTDSEGVKQATTMNKSSWNEFKKKLT